MFRTSFSHRIGLLLAAFDWSLIGEVELSRSFANLSINPKGAFKSNFFAGDNILSQNVDSEEVKVNIDLFSNPELGVVSSFMTNGDRKTVSLISENSEKRGEK